MKKAQKKQKKATRKTQTLKIKFETSHQKMKSSAQTPLK